MNAIIKGKVEVYYNEFLNLIGKYDNQCRVIWTISGPNDPSLVISENNSLGLSITYNREFLVEVLVNCRFHDLCPFGRTLSLSSIFDVYNHYQRPIDFMALTVHTPHGVVEHLFYER